MNSDTKAVLLDTLTLITTHQDTIEHSQREIRIAVSFLEKTLEAELTVEPGLINESVMHRAVELACEVYAIQPAKLYLKARTDAIVLPRQLAIYLGIQAGLTCTAASAHFGQDHGTGRHGRLAVEDRMATNPKFAATVARCIAQLNNPSVKSSVPSMPSVVKSS